jgi:REP element-mobilizing transposase RayT
MHHHLVFLLKDRKALLCKEVEEKLKQTAKEIGERYEIEFESIGYDKDTCSCIVFISSKIQYWESGEEI